VVVFDRLSSLKGRKKKPKKGNTMAASVL